MDIFKKMCELTPSNSLVLIEESDVIFHGNDDEVKAKDLEKYNKSVKSRRLQDKKHLDQNRESEK